MKRIALGLAATFVFAAVAGGLQDTDSTRPGEGGALTQRTQAEKTLSEEQEFQSKLSSISKATDGLELRLAVCRRAPSPSSTDDFERLDRDLGVVEQAAADLTLLTLTPLQQVQRIEQLDRLTLLRSTVDGIRQRWTADRSVFGRETFGGHKGENVKTLGPIPANYRIQAGDRLALGISSKMGSDRHYAVTVDRSGMITVPAAGRVLAAGKTVVQLQSLLTSKISAKFKQLRVDVSVEEPAGIAVQVMGEVARPGTYIVDSTSGLFDALRMAGGPTESGTFRKIVLTRGAKPISKIDLYAYLTKGSRTADVPLKNGDLIFVPTVGATVFVGGEVVRPRRYEPSFPIDLGEAVALAGGIKAGGNKHNIQVERVVDGEYRVLLNQTLEAGKRAGAFRLRPGDEVTVTSVYSGQSNKVLVSGPVKSPGVYGLSEGMRVKDLVDLAQGFVTDREVYGGRADILRSSPLQAPRIFTVNLDKAMAGDPANNLELQKYDQLFVYEPDQVVFRPRVVKIGGALAKPGSYRRTDGMRIGDAIAAAGGLLPEAYLERANLVRALPDDKTEIVPVNLTAAMSGDPAANLELQDRDQLTVFTRAEVQWQNRTVRIEGAVQRPGQYPRSENMRLSDLLFTSGGLLPDAAKTAEIARVGPDGTTSVLKVPLADIKPGSANDLPIGDRDVVAVAYLNPFDRTPQVVYLTGEVVRPGPYVLDGGEERLYDLIARAGGLTKSANVSGALFLRNREALQTDAQDAEANRLLKHADLLADREFVTQLAKLGLTNATAMAALAGAKDISSQPLNAAPDEALRTTSDKTQTPPDEGKGQTADKKAGSGEDKKGASPLGPILAGPDDAAMAPSPSQAEIARNAVRISVDLERALKEPGSGDDLKLSDGDRLFIPKARSVVTVIGAVLHPHRLAATSGRNVDWYIKKSGGYAQDAASRFTVVIRANGDALPARMVKTVEPGDMIIVPNTGIIDITKKLERVKDVTSVVADVLSSLFIITKL